MKKIWSSIIIFTIIFIISYISMCYLIPGMRIKLAAPPFEYFIESVKHMIVFKAAVSAFISFLLTCIFIWIKK